MALSWWRGNGKVEYHSWTIGAITTLITANDIQNDLNVPRTVTNVNVDS
jgi:hypothetical protein